MSISPLSVSQPPASAFAAQLKSSSSSQPEPSLRRFGRVALGRGVHLLHDIAHSACM